MSAYSVMFLTTASTVMEVEADSLEEAREKADEIFQAPSLCAQCTGYGNDQNLELGDWEADESDGGAWER